MQVDEKLIERLREGKKQLRQTRRSLSLPEKVRQVVELQKIELKLIVRRRPLKEHERVWDLGDNL